MKWDFKHFRGVGKVEKFSIVLIFISILYGCTTTRPIHVESDRTIGRNRLYFFRYEPEISDNNRDMIFLNSGGQNSLFSDDLGHDVPMDGIVEAIRARAKSGENPIRLVIYFSPSEVEINRSIIARSTKELERVVDRSGVNPKLVQILLGIDSD